MGGAFLLSKIVEEGKKVMKPLKQLEKELKASLQIWVRHSLLHLKVTEGKPVGHISFYFSKVHGVPLQTMKKTIVSPCPS